MSCFFLCHDKGIEPLGSAVKKTCQWHVFRCWGELAPPCETETVLRSKNVSIPVRVFLTLRTFRLER